MLSSAQLVVITNLMTTDPIDEVQLNDVDSYGLAMGAHEFDPGSVTVFFIGGGGVWISHDGSRHFMNSDGLEHRDDDENGLARPAVIYEVSGHMEYWKNGKQIHHGNHNVS
jgi:hypothetical protein